MFFSKTNEIVAYRQAGTTSFIPYSNMSSNNYYCKFRFHLIPHLICVFINHLLTRYQSWFHYSSHSYWILLYFVALILLWFCFLFIILLAFDVPHRSHHLKSAFRYRVQGMKFRTEEQSDLNDILLRVSAFGLFIYAVFSVIAGALNAFTHEPNLLVMITGLLSIAQVRLRDSKWRSPHNYLIVYWIICVNVAF